MNYSLRQFNELQKTVFAIQERISCLETNIKSTDSKPLTEKEVIEMLGISSKTLRKYRNERKIGYSQLGKKFFYRIKDVEKMLDEYYVKSLN